MTPEEKKTWTDYYAKRTKSLVDGMKGLVSLLSRRGEHIVSLYEASSVYDLPDVACLLYTS